MATEFLEALQKIKSKHDEAFKIIDQAIRNEEEENPIQALKNYKKGIEFIDEALATPVGLPDDVESVRSEWGEACKMVHKLKRARAEVVQRIGILSQTYSCEMETESPATSPVTGEIGTGRPRTYSELAQALRTLQSQEPVVETLELIFTCDGVKLYHIKGNGIVTTTSDHCTLRVLRMDADEHRGLNATYFMQIIKTCNTVPITSVDEMPSTSARSNPESLQSSRNENSDRFDARDDSSWIYPLIPGVSPCFRTEYGAFVFPDLESDEPGTSFGIVLPKEDNVEEILLEILEAILHGVVMQLKEGARRVPRDIPTQVSDNIVRGAHFVSQNLVKGAEKAGEFISYSTPYLISKLRRAPADAPPVSSNVKTTVEVAKNVTGVAATCAGYITRTIADKTNSLGRFLAPHIQRHGSTLLTNAFGLERRDANEKMSAALTIAAGAVEGFGTVYSGLEESAKVLGNNLSNNSVKIIQHKYGPSAGSLASETFDTVGNVINISRNVSIIRPQTFVKSAAKGTGKGLIQELSGRQNQQGHNFIPASSLYPDLSALGASVKK